DENGEAISEPLPVGEYTLEEIKAPKGYELLTTDLAVTVEENKESEKVIENKQTKGSIKVIKIDADEETKLQGAAFELKDEEDNSIETGLTNEEGEILFE